MVLLVRIEHVHGRPIEPEILTEATFCELCLCTNSSYEPYAVEVLSPHEICITYRQGVSLGQVAGEQFTEKVTKLEMQPIQPQGFMTSSSQNVSNFGNLSTSFQVKADIDIGKFSGTEPTPTDELNFDQWCIDVRSYQVSYPDNILLPTIQKSIVRRAKSVIRHLGPSYTVEDVITVLTQEYEGVASSDVIFKDFYQLRQERNEKVQIFSIRL